MIDTAVFGGTFDPVHSEHVSIARACVEELGVSKLIVVPTLNPPHKGGIGVSFDKRVDMLRLAFENFPCEVIISEIENQNHGVNYSSNNLPKLKRQFGDFYYIIGGDSLWGFEYWHKPEEIAQNFKVLVFNREGYPEVSDKVAELNERWGSNIQVMKYYGKLVDSHTVRIRLNLGLSAEGLPQKVNEYIAKNKLYQNYNDLLDRLPQYLSEKRLNHSKNTALMACFINNRCGLGLSNDKVILAGVLHDIGKKYDKEAVQDNQFDIPTDCIGTPVQHQFISCVLAKSDFGITDDEILNSIRYHTTGRPNMSVFEKLIYVADMLSYEREYPRVDNLREVVYENFEKGFLDCLNYSYDYLIENNKSIYPLTLDAINFYKENK